MGTLLLIVLVALLLALLFGGGGYTYRRYYRHPMVGDEIIEEQPGGSPIGMILGLVILALILLFLIYGGFNLWHWFNLAVGQPGSAPTP